MPSFIPLPLSGPSHLASPTDQAATLLRDLAVLRDEELLIAGAIGPWERSFGRAQRPARSALLIEREGQNARASPTARKHGMHNAMGIGDVMALDGPVHGPWI